MDVVELCKKYQHEGVVAIDLAGDESLSSESNPDHRRAYEVSRRRLCALNAEPFHQIKRHKGAVAPVGASVISAGLTSGTCHDKSIFTDGEPWVTTVCGTTNTCD